MFTRRTELDITVEDGRTIVEGERLEEVLTEVHRRCGDDARIISADRCVIGGVNGFFGKESFRVVAEPDDTSGELDHAEGAPIDASSFAEALAEALVAQDEGLPPAPEPAAGPATEQPAPEPATVSVSAAAASVAPLPVAPAEQPSPPPLPPAAQVQWTAPADPGGAPALPPMPCPAPLPAHDDALGVMAWQELADVASRRREPPTPTRPDVEPDPETFAELPIPAEPPVDSFTVEGPTIVLDPPSDELPPIWSGASFEPGHRAPSSESLADLLARIDLLVPGAVVEPPEGTVAIVGDAEHAVTTARRLTERLRDSERSAVVLLAPNLRARDASRVVVTSLALAADQRRRWARRPGTTFVAVALEPGEQGSEWTREALEVLAPAQVRFAAPAWRSSNELLDKVGAIGGVDCVDLVEVDPTTDPGEFLGLEPPVATIDGRGASAELWAAHLLTARLSHRNEIGDRR